MRPPAEVLSQYPPGLASAGCDFLADAGGLSGARLWRLRGDDGVWCLKAWPAATTSALQLAFGHRLMAEAARAGLPFVPRVVPRCPGATLTEFGPWLWDVVTWQPGAPPRTPNESQLAAAGTALARLHLAWGVNGTVVAPCPAVARRIRALRGVVQDAPFPPPADPVLDRLAVLARRLAPAALRELEHWQQIPLRLGPSLCDLRADHVLFVADEVTGLIDFGAARFDHPAVDLARYLGDALGGDVLAWRPLLDAYQEVRPLSAQEHDLLRTLEWTGAVASAAYWLREPSPVAAAAPLRPRWEHLLRRLEAMPTAPLLQ